MWQTPRNRLHPFVKPLITFLHSAWLEREKCLCVQLRRLKVSSERGKLRLGKYLNSRDIGVDIWCYQEQLLLPARLQTPLCGNISHRLTFCSLSSVKRLPLTRPRWPPRLRPSPDQSCPATWRRTPAACCRWPARSWTPRNCSAETWHHYRLVGDWSKNLKIGCKLSWRKLFELNLDITTSSSVFVDK